MDRKPAEPKRKKKGRPSLLDLQKRSLRLQKQQQEKNQTKKVANPSPNLNPYTAAPSGLRATRRNPNPDPDDDDDDDDDSSNGNRREKKLKLVHRIPNSIPESDGIYRDKGESNNSAKGTDALQGEPSDLGPTTPLPDKKLLEFILDRLQKKDTYGVFAEPVDHEELPDYHDIIEHPMDFATVRKKLSSEAYANLEQFEDDVFLISSNAMRYNAPDTIYYRQARAIQELARKNFENLRQESDDDDDEPEPKTVVRRGRPPCKNTKRPIGRPPIDRAASDVSSNATLANARDGSHWSNLNHDTPRKGSTSSRAGLGAAVARSSYNPRQTELFSWAGTHKSESNEEYSGYGPKGNSLKFGKRSPVVDENRRNTCKQPQTSTCMHEPSVLSAFDGERRQLVPVGLHIEHAYARSLARFAANLGPIGWAIAAKKIERVLPPGTKFGRGWIGDDEAPRSLLSGPPLLSASRPLPSPSKRNISTCTTVSREDKLPHRSESPSNDFATEVDHLRGTQLPLFTPSASYRPETADVSTGPSRGPNRECGPNLLISGGDDGASNIQSKASLQLQQNAGIQPTANGYTPMGVNGPSLIGKLGRPTSRPSGPVISDAQLTHSRALDMVSRSNIDGSVSVCHQPSMHHLDAERSKVWSSMVVNPGNPLPAAGHHNQNSEVSWQSSSQQMTQNSVPPDLNIRFQSPGSPASGVMIDTQQPDLVLQL